MASLADNNGMRGAGTKPPIATHPAFPFIVALWFAALLGLGSLLVPVPLVESLTVATGLAGIVPATAPPLGFTARALMAIAFAGAGALAGLAIARQVAKAQQVEPVRRTGPVTDRRPISAHDELGDEGLDGTSKLTALRDREPAAAPLRRIGLTALVQQAEAAEPVIDEPELDEPEMDELELADFDLAGPEPAAHELAGLQLAEQAFELADLAPAADQAATDAAPGFTTISTDSADFSRDNTMDDRQFFHVAGDASSQDREERQEFHFPAASQAPSADAPTIDLSWNDEPEDAAEFESADLAEPESDALDDDSADIALDFSPPSLTRQAFPEADPAGEEDQVEAASLDDLGLVQLAQRLGASIEKRREMRAARAALAASVAHQFVDAPVEASLAVDPLSVDLDPVDEIAQQFGLAAPDEAAEAMAAYFARPAPAVGQVVEEEGPTEENVAEEDFAEQDGPAYRQTASIYPNAEIEHEPAPRQVFEPMPEPEAEAPQVFQALTGLAQIDIDDEDADEEIAELAASFSLPLAMARPPHAGFDTAPGEQIAEDSDHEESGTDNGAGSDFASQMVLGNPFRQQPQQFVRIEDEPQPELDEAEPAVVFPAEAARIAANEPEAFESAAFQNQARANSEEHERALRDALLNLQRMSGAA